MLSVDCLLSLLQRPVQDRFLQHCAVVHSDSAIVHCIIIMLRNVYCITANVLPLFPRPPRAAVLQLTFRLESYK